MAKRTSKTVKQKNTDISQRGTRPILDIALDVDAALAVTLDNDAPMIFTLRRKGRDDGSLWLSAVGWVNHTAQTELDVYPTANGCEIIIPDSYAKDISDDARLYVSCAALNLRGDVSWRAEAVEVNAAEAVVDARPDAKTGIMSRFLPKSTAPETPSHSDIGATEAERRSRAAEDAAKRYRAEMQAAADAREAAQAKALEAARKAEAALALETARIAEMEKAATALAAAEAARQDEQRRLDAERRAQALRDAEMARLAKIEEERKIAAARAQALAEEKSRITAQIEAASQERARLTEHLSTTRSTLHRITTDLDTKTNAKAALAEKNADFESTLEILAQDVSASKSAIGALNARIDIAAQRKSESQEALAAAEQVEAEMRAAHATALVELEAAKARLELVETQLNTHTQERADISARADTHGQHIQALSGEVVKAGQDLAGAQSTYDTAQAESDEHHGQIAALQSELDNLSQAKGDQDMALAGLTADLERALSDQDAASLALQTLNDGGEIAAARQILASAHDGTLSKPIAPQAEASLAAPKVANTSPSRLKAMFGGAQANAIAVAPIVEKSSAPANAVGDTAPKDQTARPATLKASAVVLTATDDTASTWPVKQVAMGAAALALTAVLGYSGSAALRANPDTQIAMKSAPAEVLSANTVATPQKSSASIAVKPKADAMPEPVTAPRQYASVDVTDMARKAARDAVRQSKPKLRTAVKRPSPAPVKQAPARKIPAVKSVAKVALVTSRPQPVSAPVSAAPFSTPVKTAALAAPTAPRLSPSVARAVQADLQTLGYYSGAIDGQSSQDLSDAAKLFADIYDVPNASKITPSLISRLSREATSVRNAPVTQVIAPEPKAVQIASAAVVSDPVALQPAAAAPIVTPPKAEAVKTASVAPTIIEPKALSPMRVNYPSRAARRDIYENVVVDIDFDIDVDGTVTNVRVVDIDYTGRQSRAFEDAAIKGVMNMRYSPKTIDGQAVATPSQRKTVRFRVE